MKIVYITNDAFGHGGVARMLSVKTAVLAQKYGHQVVIISSSFFAIFNIQMFHLQLEILDSVLKDQNQISYF